MSKFSYKALKVGDKRPKNYQYKYRNGGVWVPGIDSLVNEVITKADIKVVDFREFHEKVRIG